MRSKGGMEASSSTNVSPETKGALGMECNLLRDWIDRDSPSTWCRDPRGSRGRCSCAGESYRKSPWRIVGMHRRFEALAMRQDMRPVSSSHSLDTPSWRPCSSGTYRTITVGPSHRWRTRNVMFLHGVHYCRVIVPGHGSCSIAAHASTDGLE